MFYFFISFIFHELNHPHAFDFQCYIWNLNDMILIGINLGIHSDWYVPITFVDILGHLWYFPYTFSRI